MTILLVHREMGEDLFQERLRECGPIGQDVRPLGTLMEASQYLTHTPADLLILDLGIPDPPDLEAFRRFLNTTDHIPVILLVRREDEDRALAWINAGAQDMLIHGDVDPHHLGRVLRTAMERREARAALSRQAQYDPLTRLPNRALFRDRLRLALARSAREGTPVAVLFLDLDRFKDVNDSLGHDMGDVLLKAVADRLLGCVRRTDTVARHSGDEFTAVVECPSGPTGAAAVADKMRHALTSPFRLEGHEIRVGASVGIAMAVSEETEDLGLVDRLLKRADMAMYRAKALGGDTFQFHSHDMGREFAARAELERDLREAVIRGEFALHWQGQFDLDTGELIGLEALLRWMHPTRGLLLPGAFLRIAHDAGLAEELGRWVLRTAVDQARTWESQGISPHRIAINFSTLQLRHPGFVQGLQRALETSGWPANRLELEFSETGMMALARGDEVLAPVDGLGVRIALDDFGAGFSSLPALRRLPLSTLKLDPSFARATGSATQDVALATAAIQLARALGLRTVAEGIETPQEVERLAALGCDAGQGYQLHPPEPADVVTAWLKRRHSAVA